jgi:hypothetical protein
MTAAEFGEFIAADIGVYAAVVGASDGAIIEPVDGPNAIAGSAAGPPSSTPRPRRRIMSWCSGV